MHHGSNIGMMGSEPTATCSMGPHGAQVALKPEKSGRLKSASFEGDVFGAPHTTVCETFRLSCLIPLLTGAAVMEV